MRRTVTPLCVFLGALGLMVFHPPASSAQSLLFDYVGFDYESPNPDPSQFGEAGSGYVSLGLVPGLFAPLVADTMANEYTYVISALTPVSFGSFPPYIVVDYGPGNVQLYEDSKSTGTAADYGENPPNAAAPPSFTDGIAILVGDLTGFRIILNTANGTGSFEARLDVTGGSQLGNFPLNQRTGWTFAGATGNAVNIPAGYEHQIDGQAFLNEPVPARRVSWGHLKATYR